MVTVCHLTSAHKRYDIRIFQKQCRSLVKNGYDVTLIVSDEKENEIYRDIKIISTGYLPKTRWKRIGIAANKVFQLALEVNADIYCFHDPELLRFAKKLKKHGKKVIFDSHEFYALQILTKNYIPKTMRRLVANIYQQIEKQELKYVDAVLTPCTIDGENYFFRKAKKTVYIANLPKLSTYYDYYDNSIKKQNQICYVGSLSSDRGIYHLIKSTEKYKARLVLGGNFSTKEFQKEVENMKEYKNVEYLGYIQKDEVRKLYMESEIGICTLLNEGQHYHVDTMGTKVYEYMSLGLPVIVSNTSYVKRIMEKYHFGIAVKPDCIEEIAQAVNFILDHEIEAKQMGQSGREAILKEFNWSVEERKLLDLYSELSEDYFEGKK